MLEEIAGTALDYARQMGASEAECTVAENDEFHVTIRLGEVEALKQSGARAAGLRLLFGRRSGASHTSDLTTGGIREMARQAAEIAALTSEDPHAGLPEPGELGAVGGDLALYHPDVEQMPAAARIDLARRAEQAALAVDARISRSDGATFGARWGRRLFANTRGFLGTYRTSSCSLSVVPVARDSESMERDFWYSVARSAAALEPPEQVGRLAAQRALRRLHPRKLTTCRAAVVFEPRVARSLAGHLFDAVQGEAVVRKASFLAGKLGDRIASGAVTLVDDATLPGLFATAPFDDEGVPTRRTTVIDRGVLTSYLLNTYAARRLGLTTTGNASRAVSGNLSVGNGNLYLEPGAAAVDALLRSAGRGLYVTELMGFGVNTVTGDYSRGAAGLWIEDGELAFPVSEVTISGSLPRMLADVEMVANDLEFRGSVAAPTILIREMTISGR